MNVRRGRPGPLLRFGVPFLVACAVGYFGFKRWLPALNVLYKTHAGSAAPTVGASAGGERGTLRICAGRRSSHALFRDQARLRAALRQADVELTYLPDPALESSGERMRALVDGRVDLAVLTLDEYLVAAPEKRVEGVYPAQIIFGVAESAGGDAVFLSKARANFDALRPDDTVCLVSDSVSQHLWDFVTLSFEALSGGLAVEPARGSAECLEHLLGGRVQVAVLAAPESAIAAKQGYLKPFATGDQGDDLVLDVVVVGRGAVERQHEAVQRLTTAYFNTIGTYARDKALLASELAADCGSACASDASIGAEILRGVDFLDLEENACIWFGECGGGGKLAERVAKTAKLLAAKKRQVAGTPVDPTSVFDASFIRTAKQQRVDAQAVASGAVGPAGVVAAPAADAPPIRRYSISAAVVAAEEPAKIGTLTLPTIAFEHGSFQLNDSAQATIVTIAEKLRSFPAMCIRIVGYSTPQEDSDPNHRLSKLRGMAIAQELTRIDPAGFPDERFDVRALGSGRLPTSKRDPKALPRRTEFALFTCATK